MSDLLVRRAFEKYLTAAGWGGLAADDTYFENEAREPPADAATPYQKCFLLPAEPDNEVAGTSMYLAHGIFQITLLYPLGEGAGAAAALAETIRGRFKRGTTMTESGLNVLVTNTPLVASGFEDNRRWNVPVSIRWQAWVNTP